MSRPGPLADDLFEDNKDRLRDAVEAIGRAQAEGERRPTPKWRVGLAVSVGTIVALALAAELFLRVTDDREEALAEGMNRINARWLGLMRADVFEEVDDDVRHYAMRPGADTTIDGWRFRVNAHRGRGDELAAVVPAGEKRMLMLGDSFCFGMWCDEDETLVGHLVRMANERAPEGTTWKAINLGVPGYHSGQQLRALEQDGLALDPDVVVVYFNGNDVETSGYFYDAELMALRSDHLPLPHGLKRALWTSHLYGWLARKHYHAYRSVPDAPFDERVPWAHTREDNQRATRAALTRIVELCRERGIGVFLVNQPFLAWSGAARDPEWRGRELSAFAEDVRADLGVPGIDLVGWLAGYSDGVDRLPEPFDFLPDTYVADPAVETAVAEARALAAAEGADYDAASLDDKIRWLTASGFEQPDQVDFHLTGDGYRLLAELAYPKLAEAGLVP